MFSLSPTITDALWTSVLTEAITRRTRVSHLLLWFLLFCSSNGNTCCPVCITSRFEKWEGYRWESHWGKWTQPLLFLISLHIPCLSSQILYLHITMSSFVSCLTIDFPPWGLPSVFFFQNLSVLPIHSLFWLGQAQQSQGRFSIKLPFVQLPPQHKGSSTVRFDYTKSPLVQVPPLISTQTKRRGLILEILLMTFQRYGHQSSCSPSGRML